MRVFALIALMLWSGWLAAKSGTVIDGVHANLRSGKTESARVIRVLPPRTPLEILQTDQRFAKVRTAAGETGWLPMRLLSISRRPQAAAVVATAAPPVATERELQQTRERLSRLENALAQERSRAQANLLRMAILVGCGALLVGMALGIAVLQLYYRKRLNGLRI